MWAVAGAKRQRERGVKRGDRVAGSKARTRCESAAFEGVKYSNKEPGLATYVWNIYICGLEEQRGGDVIRH